MRKNRISRRLTLLGAAAALTLTGCAPAFGSGSLGPGLQLGIALGQGLQLSTTSCALLGTSAPEARMGMMSAAAIAGARMQQVAAVQSKFMMGANSIEARMARAKRLGAGEC